MNRATQNPMCSRFQLYCAAGRLHRGAELPPASGTHRSCLEEPHVQTAARRRLTSRGPTGGPCSTIRCSTIWKRRLQMPTAISESHCAVDQANAMTRTVHSRQLPTVGASPSFRDREGSGQPRQRNEARPRRHVQRLLLPLDAELRDRCMGKNPSHGSVGQATAQASAADLRFVELSVSASVAVDYYNLRETDAELQISTRRSDALQHGYQIVDNQFHHGLVSEFDVKQAQTLLDQVRSQRDAMHIQRAQMEHAIAELLGRTPEGFHIAADAALETPPTIPAGVPSQLLERRPDIIAAERSLAAASAQIGVAKAAYFPQLSISAFAGFESTYPASIVNWQNSIASLAASATAPIFTGGRLRANLDQARASYRGSVSEYEKTVLTAYQQVEDQLAALHFLALQQQDSTSAVTSAGDEERIAENRYQAGLVSYLNVVYAEQTLLQNEQSEAQVSGQQLIATVVLVKALGGGWEDRPHP